MQYAAKLSPRAVISSGRGSSSAGLTVTAIKDGGQWALEAGALVLADGESCRLSLAAIIRVCLPLH